MKKYLWFTSVFVALFFIQTNAQLNYVFTSYSTTYDSLVDGNFPPLDNPSPQGYYEHDEGFSNALPIGFNFVFDGVTYTTININVNGFVSFGTPFDIGVSTFEYSTNNLINGPKQAGVKPIIAPLWDDLKLKDNRSIRFVTQGNAPNRSFVVEWKNVFWNYGALRKCLDFQMILFEGTNKIKFVYGGYENKLSNASASIGIATNNGFLSVNQLTSNASVSSVKEYNEVNDYPATPIAFEFDPGKQFMPKDVIVNNYASRKITYSWLQNANSNCDYAISTSVLQPSIFTNTSLKTITANTLTANTQYYIHIRSNNLITKSGWVTIPFKTAYETGFPYLEDFNTVASNNIPVNTINANPTLQNNQWKTYTYISTGIKNTVANFNNQSNTTADGWLILPAAKLQSSDSYKFKFGYKINDSTTTGINEKIEIKIGKLINNAMSGWQTLYKNYTIINKNFKDTSFVFSPQTDDYYFIAIRCVSEKIGGELWIDNIAFERVVPLSAKLLSFAGYRKDDGTNSINWKTNTEFRCSKFELQRSADNKNFSTILIENSKSSNGISAVPLNYAVVDAKPDFANYYRLKVIDLDGNYGFSQSIRVSGSEVYKLHISNSFPNPTKDLLTLVVNSPYSTKAKLRVFDMFGQMLAEYDIDMYSGDNLLKTDLGKLQPGQYVAKVFCIIGDASNAYKIIKL